MKNFCDISVGNISIVVKKRERSDFVYRCDSRSRDGFIFVTDGQGFFERGERRIPLQKNALMILSKGEKYSISAADDSFEYITTAFDILPDDALHTIGLPHFIQISDHSPLPEQFDGLLELWIHRSQLYVLKTRIQLEQMILELAQLCAKGQKALPEENRILSAVEHIHRFYDQDISVEQLADLCNLSVSQFRRVFKTRIGMTPMQYREAVRMHWAKQLLGSELFSISEIAARLGYYDIYHFSKKFKLHTGYSPRQYMKRHMDTHVQ